MTAQELANIIGGYRLPVAVEADMQAAMAELLSREGVPFKREVTRGRDRIDFLVERVGVECKVHCPVSRLTAQLERYARWEDVDELLVVTSDGKHRSVPGEVNGKPVTVQVVRGML